LYSGLFYESRGLGCILLLLDLVARLGARPHLSPVFHANKQKLVYLEHSAANLREQQKQYRNHKICAALPHHFALVKRYVNHMYLTLHVLYNTTMKVKE
jgi:hypothetical protein